MHLHKKQTKACFSFDLKHAGHVKNRGLRLQLHEYRGSLNHYDLQNAKLLR